MYIQNHFDILNIKRIYDLVLEKKIAFHLYLDGSLCIS
jgi:hypothetical protein